MLKNKILKGEGDWGGPGLLYESDGEIFAAKPALRTAHFQYVHVLSNKTLAAEVGVALLVNTIA